MFLVVDLDGTLLKSDMLHESFWKICLLYQRLWSVPLAIWEIN
jgi:beta-phosphoglucomutase-like phosphatase (HAD superfamily)